VIINIYTRNNGVGLEADAKIIKACLPNHTVNIIDWEHPAKKAADIGIHLEHIRAELLHLARYNVAVPNPEWFEPKFVPLLKRIDAVWCKTNYTLSLFTPLHRNCTYTGFTSVDHYKNGMNKRKMFLHLAGKSSHKGSEAVLQLWKRERSLPLLCMQKLENNAAYRFTADNYVGQFERIKDITEIMNTALFHLCCSKAEGFGHYINEAMSAGGIVITTDAPPMNELVPVGCGFTVPAIVCGKHRLSNEFCVIENELRRVILEAYATPNDVLIEMSARSREVYLQRDADFKKKINQLIDEI
jgi:glycosyltransferase involved in cell wall biosynthesis